ncbi:hypothetical protein Tco_0439904 [Tanacetum coccineum]
MGMYISSQNSCDFTTVTINGETEERRTTEEIIQNYYDREDGETTPRFEITILKTNTPYPSRKIRRIRACTHQRPQKDKAQYTVSRGLNTPYSRYGINIIFWKISSVVPTLRNPQYAVRIYQKLPENSQKRASTDTRTEQCTKAGCKAKEKSILSQKVKEKSTHGQQKSTTRRQNPK